MTERHQKLINAFWKLIEPDPEAYSRWLNRCLELLPEETVRDLLESMRDPSDAPKHGDECPNCRCGTLEKVDWELRCRGECGMIMKICLECCNGFDDNPGKNTCKTCEDWA